VGLWDRLTAGLTRTQEAVTGRIARAFENVVGERLDDATAEELEEALLAADLGVDVSERVLEALRRRRGLSGVEAWRDALAEEIAAVLTAGAPAGYALEPPPGVKPWVVLVIGVNGVGKTTMIGKLAAREKARGRRPLVVAADTFRAAAADQLQTWGERVGAPVVRGPEGGDPASVAFDAVRQGADGGYDVVLVDTAGRLQNKVGLMDELGKVKRVVEKQGPVDEVLLVLDATTGQNGLVQARVFAEAVDVTGIVLTKLDGTAKGGIVVAVQRELGVPVKLVGLGEGADDLAPFEPEVFVDALLAD
jgi:fused signal recognition particle receptor